MRSPHFHKVAGTAVCLCLNFAAFWSAPAAAAENAGTDSRHWLVRGGVAAVLPTSSARVNVGTPAEGTVEFQPAVTVAIDATYLFTSHWGVDWWLTAPAEHDLEFSAGSMKQTVAHADTLQTTLSLQYSFIPAGRIRPYVGAGINLTDYSSEKFTAVVQGPQNLDLKRSLGFAVQAGVDVPFGMHWLANAELRFADSSPTAYVDGVRLQTLQVDPLCIGINAGWRF